MSSFLNPFKDALRENRRQTGLWMTTGSPTITEIAAGTSVLIIGIVERSLATLYQLEKV
jgi:2-keto-3-deoxy-L-rhamnonate aldolase RhmA